jgi:hypothetical protein
VGRVGRGVVAARMLVQCRNPGAIRRESSSCVPPPSDQRLIFSFHCVLPPPAGHAWEIGQDSPACSVACSGDGVKETKRGRKKHLCRDKEGRQKFKIHSETLKLKT